MSQYRHSKYEVRVHNNPRRSGEIGMWLFLWGLAWLFGCGFLTFCGLVAEGSWAYMPGVGLMVIGGCLFWETD